MWLMMAVEVPGQNAVIARMPNAEANLAAAGIVFSLALVIESPVIQILAAATALSGNRANYRVLLRSMHVMSAALVGLHLIIALTPAFALIVEGLLGVPEDIAQLSRMPFVIMAPFSAAVGYRRLFQGSLIRHGKTVVIPVTMATRLLVVALFLWIGFRTNLLTGAALASISLSVAAIAAAGAAWLFHRVMVIPMLPEQSDDEPLSMRGFVRFYIPLSMTSVVFLLSRPLLTFGIARSALARQSLAVWPVMNGFLFIFNSIALSYQEAAISVLRSSPQSRDNLRRFSLAVSIALSGLLLIAGLTPLGEWWFTSVSGLPEDLTDLTRIPIFILAVVPALAGTKAWFRAQYVDSRRTAVLAQSVSLYTVVLLLCATIGSAVFSVVGTILAASSLVIAQSTENIYLLARRPARQIRATARVDG